MPWSLAFAPPLFLPDHAKYIKGDNSLCDDEILFADIFQAKGEPELARSIRDGRIRQRLDLCIGGQVWKRSNWFDPQFQGLQVLLFGPDHPEIEWEAWRAAAMKRYENDAGLKVLLREESDSIPK